MMMDLRTKRTANSMDSIQDFKRLWDGGVSHPAPIVAQEVGVSQYQNINAGGTPGGLYAPTFTPSHRQFDAVIEPLVRPLVKCAVKELGLITYTSCQGHAYSGWQSSNELHIGILPRSSSEAYDIGRMLESRLGAARSLACEEVEPEVYYGELWDKADHSRFPVVDLYLSKGSACSWEHYMAARERCVDAIVRLLRGPW